MNDPTNNAESGTEQWVAFQRIWTETFTRMMQLGFTAPESAPPEFVRDLRAGILQALSQSWDQFLRSPQFLESMKQWMDNTIAVRQMSNEFLTRVRHEGQAPARDDIDHVLRAVEHLENRLLARIDTLTAQVAALQRQAPASAPGDSAAEPPPSRSPRRKAQA